MSSLAGSFLVARHLLKDKHFFQSVVLLLKHNDEGAFGLVVNRPAKADGIPFPVFDGGPCPMDGFIMLHGHANWLEPSPENEVAPGIYLGDRSCMDRVTDPSPDQVLRVRVFSGYAGWAPDQLEGEIAAGAWSIASASGPVLFDTPTEDLWDSLVPPRIPRPSVN
jgi:putative transcriptional regulator